MKAETKNKYLERINTCMRLLMQEVEQINAAEEPDASRMGKVQGLFNESKAVQGKLLDGLFLSSVDASNTIHQLELKIKRLNPDATAQDPDDPTAVPNWNNTSDIPEDAPDIVQAVARAQKDLLDVYEKVVKKNPIAAHVPVVVDLQTAARGLNTIMQGLAKVGALL